MKLVFDLSKSLDKTKLVQVQRTVQGKHGQYQRMQWVKPSDVKDTDKVVGGQDSMEISEKNFPVGSKIYYKGEEATVQRVGKEFSGGGMGIVVRFSKGGTGTIGKSDMKNVSKTPPTKSSNHAPFADASSQPPSASEYGKFMSDANKKLNKDDGYKVVHNNIDYVGYSMTTPSGNKVKIYKDHSGDGYTAAISNGKGGYIHPKDDSGKYIHFKNPDEVKKWIDENTGYGNKSTQGKPEPKKSDTITVKGKTFKAKNGVITVSMYDLQERLSKVEKFAKDNGYKVEYAESKKNNSDSVPNKALGKTWSDTKTELGKMGYKVDSIFSSQPPQPKEKLILYKDGKEYEAEVTKYHNGDYEILGSSIKEVKKDDTKSNQDDKSSNPNTDVKQDSDKKSGKFSMSEFTGIKSDRTKAIQYLKDNGISWKETDNEGINWMRACMAASRAENPAQGATKKDFASKSSADTKASGKSIEEAKKAVKDLLSANNNDRAKVMQIAKASGVTWKESDNDGINWMRASLAIQKNYESGKTISVSDSDAKKDDTKTDDKPNDKKVSISDLKRPASNNTSTNLVAGDYNISVTKLRNVGANSKQHPSFYRIVVEKDGDRVFYTDKTDWSDIKEHAKRYIDSASNSDSKSDKKSDSKPTHDNPLVTTETKSGKPYQIWESNGRIYGSLPGKQDSRNARDIRDFTSSGFETLDEVKDYIKKYF